MGTISANKLGGLLLMLAPAVTLVFYFLQPGGTFIDTADPADGAATIVAMISNPGLGKVVSVCIPIGLLAFLYGIFVLQGNVKSSGNGDALARLGVLFTLTGVFGWIIGFAASLAITGSGLPAAAAVPLFGSLYSATVGIGTISGILAGLGFLALALAISTRDDSSKPLALAAAAAALVAVVVTIIGGIDTTQLQTMSTVTGITYLVHVVWFFALGRSLVKGP